MKRSAKKVLSLLLATVLVLSSVFCITATTERDTVLLSEDFQDLASLNEGDALPATKYAAASSATWRFATNEAWSSTTSYKVHKKSTDAELMGNGQCIVYNDSAAYAWKNYTLEFKFTIAKIDDTAPTLATPTNRVYYGMTFGIEDPTAPKGLEFAIAYQPSSGNFGYRVYDRVAKAMVITATDLAAGKFAFGTEASIKIVVDGKSFELYLNGEKLGETQTLTRDIVGTIATYMSDNQVNTYYDDIKVTGEKPEEGPAFETIVDEDFSANTKPANWYATSIVTFTDGKAVMISPNASTTGRIVYNAAEAATWGTYNVDADIQIGADSEVAALSFDSSGDAYFRVAVATNSLTDVAGIEIGIIYNKNSDSWFWRVYDRWAAKMVVAKAAIPEGIAGDIAFGKTFHVRVEKDGVKLAVYINNKLLGKGTTAENRVGSFGFGLQHAFSYASVDNVKVTMPVKEEGGLTTYLEDFAPGQYTASADILALYVPQATSGGNTLAKDAGTKYFNTQQNADAKQYILQTAPDGTANIIRGAQGNLVYINRSALYWENYTASVDVALGPKSVGSNWYTADEYTVDFRAGIAFAISDYDTAPQNRFEIYYDGANSQYRYKLFLANSSVADGVIEQSLEFGQFVNVKVELNGAAVKAYVEDKLVVTKTASAALIGSVALRMTGTKSFAFFENLLVEGPELAEVDPDEPVPSTSSLFFDDFNKKDGTFTPAEGTWKAAGVAEYLENKLYITNTTGIYYTAPAAANWENYLFTTQMMITDKNTAGGTWATTDGAAISGVVFGALMKSDNSGYAGYEFTISYDGSKFDAKLFDRNDGSTLATASDISGITVGEMFLLAVDFKTNLIECFVNGNKVLTYTVVNGDVTKGSIGLLSGTARTKFNYVHVVQGLAPEIDEDTEEPTANENTIYLNKFNETDGDVTAIENCSITGQFEYVNGRLRNKAFSGNGNLLVYTGEGATSLKNYSVTAEVVLTQKDPATGAGPTSTATPYFGIYFGINDTSAPFANSYEATLYYKDNAFNARIYKNYAEKTFLAGAKKVDGLQLNKAMVLRIDFWEDTVNFSINGELVNSYSGEALNSGTFALFAGAWRTKFNYIHVEKSANPDKDEETPIITYVDDDFDSYTDGQSPISSKNGWNGANSDCYVKGGKLYLPEARSTNIYAKSLFTNGCVSADVIIEKPSDAFTADGTKYPVWLVGRYTNSTSTGSNELRIRVALTKKGTDYTVKLETVVYSDTNVDATGAKKPVLESFPMPGFEFGKPINLKLSCIGNYLEIAVDGAVVYQRACDSADALYNHIGQFGISTLGNVATVALDNVSIKKYNIRNISVDSSCASNVELATYGNAITVGPKTVTRNAYYIGEHVVFNLNPASGYVVDPANLKYTTSDGDTPIVDHKDDVTYGFFMPDKDVTIFAAFKEGGSSEESDIFFEDNFDGEDFMTERGWSKDTSINMGRVYLPATSDAVYLTGIAGCGSWTDYVFEADASVGDEDPTVTNSNSAVAISAHTSGTSNGYEFGIFMPTKGSNGYFRLYDRGAGVTLATTASGTALRGQTYSMKMIIEGKRIYCLVDGELIFDVTADEKTEGSVGLRSNTANAYFDNVVVRKITQADRDEIAGKKPHVDPVKPDPKEEDSPITGEQSVMLILVLCAVSAACAVLVLMAKCRKMTF